MRSGLFKRFLARVGLGQKKGIPVFRVQGGVLPNASKVRFQIDDAGNLSIEGNDILFINVNQETRALEFLQRRGESAHLVRFEIEPAFLERLRSSAVPEVDAAKFPGRPLVVDPTRATGSDGIPSNLFDELL